MFKKDLTLPELEKLEAEKNEQLQKINDEIEDLKGKRPEILLRMAEEDQTDFQDLEKCDASIARLKLEAEVIKTVLDNIPKRKNYARGVEIETMILELERKSSEFKTLMANISKKVPPLIKATRDLYDFLEGFGEVAATRGLRLRGNFLDAGLNGLRDYAPVSATVASDSKILDIEPIVLAMVYDKEKLAAWIDKAQLAITDRLDKMRNHAKRLKGEKVPEPKWPYCPKCFENTGYPDAQGNCHCGKCGETFTWNFGFEEGDQNE